LFTSDSKEIYLKILIRKKKIVIHRKEKEIIHTKTLTIKTKELDRADSQNANRSNIKKVYQCPLPYADTYKKTKYFIVEIHSKKLKCTVKVKKQ